MNNFMLPPADMMKAQSVTEILQCNEITSPYGLILSQAEVYELIETREKTLSSNGRIEFSGGIINKLIIAFCDSPFLSQFNYAATLNELIETFYYFKNETLDEMGDDELISLMKKCFDRNCQGSIDLLQGRELESIARTIRYGLCDYSDLLEDSKDLFNEEDYNE